MKNKESLYSSVFLSPFKYLRPSVHTEAALLLVLLLLQVLMLFITKSFDSIIILVASLLASLAADFCNKERNYLSGFEIMTSSIRGLIIGLLLPSSFPPLAVFFISFITLFLNRNILGGFANSWVNPIAVIISICWVIGMKFFPSIQLPFDILSSKNIALSLIQNGTFQINAADLSVTSFLNKRIFTLFGVSIPEGYFSLFWDTHSSIPAFRFNLLTIISSIVLLGIDVLNPIIPGVFLLTYSVLVKFLAPLFCGGELFHGDILMALLSSGTLFCTFFLLSWHGTTPFTNRGKFFYGLFAGITAFFIIGIGLSPCGFVFIVLVTNVFSLFIQNIENHFYKEFTLSVLVPKAKAVWEGNDA